MNTNKWNSLAFVLLKKFHKTQRPDRLMKDRYYVNFQQQLKNQNQDKKWTPKQNKQQTQEEN